MNVHEQQPCYNLLHLLLPFWCMYVVFVSVPDLYLLEHPSAYLKRKYLNCMVCCFGYFWNLTSPGWVVAHVMLVFAQVLLVLTLRIWIWISDSLINSWGYLGVGWKNLGHLIDTLWYLAIYPLKLRDDSYSSSWTRRTTQYHCSCSPPGQLFWLDGSSGSFLVPDYSPSKS